MAWDMWEQRNDIKHHTLHLRRAAEVARIKVQLQLSCRKGTRALLAQDHILFSKAESKLLGGSQIEMLQWTTSVLLATGRAAVAKDDQEATMRSERSLMKCWLTDFQTNAPLSSTLLTPICPGKCARHASRHDLSQPNINTDVGVASFAEDLIHWIRSRRGQSLPEAVEVTTWLEPIIANHCDNVMIAVCLSLK